MRELVRFVLDDPEVSRCYMEKVHPDFTTILVTMGVEHAANTFMLRHGDVASDAKTRSSVLQPLLNGLTDDWLKTPVVIPIALVRFDFDRVRLAKNALLIRMSDGLHRARWEGKAHAANGHDAVLASATHALVLTEWGVANHAKLSLGEILSAPSNDIAAVVDSFFAALRLRLDIDTGYAQEIRLARGWRSHDRLGDPEVYAVGARRYPPHFDNYGWMNQDLPLVSKDDMKAVARTWAGLLAIEDSRFALALRRFNAASTRDELADVILDATIALEILLGDSDGQSISWKLRMRAAALIGLDADRSRMEEVRTAINDTYGFRSAIVHGGRRKSKDLDEYAAAKRAVDVLRTVINSIIAHPAYLDPLKIDTDLLLTSRVAGAAEPADETEEDPEAGSEV
ncbi:HEPN domain-containing protein [Sphingomonas echinoides]|uniref:HEPN domain-containing protein n=1 Tax=Sphingomonas echinoides TaxID=59803 RepID=A0ABU4PLJ9_9SPHN|nr:HEPN domain-containing protein [Sphingomonas echinoides]MDX5985063.1 HEPN domain-containing protein [Sphingomonas echinoides]